MSNTLPEHAINAFQVHHIFASEFFNDPVVANGLAVLFPAGTTGISLDMAGNEIALFSNAAQAAAVRGAVGVGARRQAPKTPIVVIPGLVPGIQESGERRMRGEPNTRTTNLQDGSRQ